MVIRHNLARSFSNFHFHLQLQWRVDVCPSFRCNVQVQMMAEVTACKRESKYEYLPRSHSRHLSLVPTGPIHFHPLFTAGPRNSILLQLRKRQRMAVKQDDLDMKRQKGKNWFHNFTRIHHDYGGCRPFTRMRHRTTFQPSIIRT